MNSPAETTHPARATGTTQCAAILAVLEENAGEWVSLIDLWKASGSMAVHSRINDLRQRGHSIQHINERTESGKVHSSYRLLEPSSETSSQTLSPSLINTGLQPGAPEPQNPETVSTVSIQPELL